LTDQTTEGPVETGPSGSEPAVPESRPPLDGRRRAVAIAIPVLIAAALVAVLVTRDDEPAVVGEDPLVVYCATAVERDSIPIPDPAEADNPDVRNSVPPTAARMVLLTEKMFSVAPQQVKPDLQRQINLYREVVRSADARGFEKAELLDALNKVAAEDISTCNLQEVDFAASQFQYRGFPDELDSGKSSFRMRNESNERHEMVLFRRNPEFEGEFSEILSANKEGEQAILVAAGRADPEKTDYMVVDLLNGDYALTCFVKSGPDFHWQKGEIKEFYVR
jgi:hypothetical protein